MTLAEGEGSAPAPAPEGAAALFAGDGGGGPADTPPAGDAAGAPAWWEGEGFGVSAEKPADGISDAEWLANKKFGGFGDLIKSARSLESKLGSDRVPLPKGADDKEGWDTLAKALGRPDTPDGYELKLAAGYDEGFVKAFREQAHALGLPPHAAQGLVEWFEGTTAAEANANAEAAAKELQGVWQGEYKANMELSRRAMEMHGLTPDDLNAMSQGYGLAKTMQLMARIGRATAEDNGMPGDGGGQPGRTPEQLATRKAEILSSRELSEKLRAGDPGLKAEWEAIMEVEAAALERRYGK
ncbi:MAG: hypothetical protein WDA25_01000 [Paracoccaceae bacterium]